jgi:predicted nuclease of predicted toxin-antitoxin system
MRSRDEAPDARARGFAIPGRARLRRGSGAIKNDDHAVRLLIDGALSPSLLGRLANAYPGSVHLRIGQHPTSDPTLVQLAGLIDAVIVTTASDFDDLVLLEPDGGRVLRLDVGPCSTDETEGLLCSAAGELPEPFATARIVTITRQR